MGDPLTLEEARKKRYHRWACNPEGWEYVEGQCAASAYNMVSRLFYQRSRKNGYGPAGLYCKQHAKMVRS